MRAEVYGAVGCLCMWHSVWALVLVQALSLYVRGVNGLTQAHSWAQCSLQVGAFKLRDYSASCVQTDASDKTYHTDEAPSYVPTSPFQRERWKRAQYSSTSVTLPPNTHLLSLINTGLHNRKTTCLRQGTQTSRQLQATWHSIKLSPNFRLPSKH